MKISDSSYYPQLVLDESTATLEVEREIFKPHFGNNFMFKFKNGSPLLTIGPHWPFTLCLILCILGASFLLESVVRQKNTLFWSLSTLGSGFLLIVALLFVSLKNPGVNLTLQPVTLTDTSCRACKLEKAQGTVHCTECDICIRGHDHHCPWVGKCVGENNIFEFQIFLLTFTFFFTFNLIVIVL